MLIYVGRLRVLTRRQHDSKDRSIRGSGLPSYRAASAEQNVTMSSPLENPEEWPPCSTHKPKHNNRAKDWRHKLTTTERKTGGTSSQQPSERPEAQAKAQQQSKRLEAQAHNNRAKDWRHKLTTTERKTGGTSSQQPSESLEAQPQAQQQSEKLWIPKKQQRDLRKRRRRRRRRRRRKSHGARLLTT